MVPRHSRPHPEPTASPDDLRVELEACSRELDELRLQLESQQAAGLRFVTGAAHAVLNPLTIVHSYLELTLSDLSDGLSEDQLTFLRAARDAASRLRSLVDDLLELAAFETGAAEVQEHEVRLQEEVLEVSRVAAQRAEAADVSLSVEVPDDLPSLLADRRQLRGAVARIIESAVAAAASGGRVTVVAAARPRHLVLTCTDTGPAIEDDDPDRIFEPFAELQAPGGRRRPGLALALARRRIAACGGTTTAVSSREAGTTITVTLPLASPDDDR